MYLYDFAIISTRSTLATETAHYQGTKLVSEAFKLTFTVVCPRSPPQKFVFNWSFHVIALRGRQSKTPVQSDCSC